MSWIFFSLLASFLWALTYFVDEYLVKKTLRDPVALVSLTGLFSFFPLVFLLIKNGIPTADPTTIILGILSGAAGLLVLLPYLVALQSSSSAQVSPLWSMAPIFIVILAFLFLGERLTSNDYVAIVLLIASAVIATYKRGERKAENRALFFMGLASIIYAAESILNKALYERIDYSHGFFFVLTGSLIVGIVLYLLHGKPLSIFKKIFARDVVGLTLVNEIVNFSGIAFANLAVSLGPVSLVKAVGELQPIFILLMTAVVVKIKPSSVFQPLDRSLTRRVVISVIFAVAGLLLISSI